MKRILLWTDTIINLIQKPWLKYTLVILWMLLIYLMSNMDSVKSWYLTGETLTVIEQKSEETSDLNYDEKISYYNDQSNMILLRKAAHVIEYFVLTLLLVNAFASTPWNRRAYIKALSIGFIYACIDEFHQMFVPGRTSNYQDVLIDSLGLIVGVLSIYFIRKYYNTLKSTLKAH